MFPVKNLDVQLAGLLNVPFWCALNELIHMGTKIVKICNGPQLHHHHLPPDLEMPFFIKYAVPSLLFHDFCYFQ